MAVCEFLGGPRDGEQFIVPGTEPPAQITVLVHPHQPIAGNQVLVWHPALGDVPTVVVTLTHHGRVGSPWRYRWPTER